MKDQLNAVTESEPFGYQLQQLWDFSGILRSNTVEYIDSLSISRTSSCVDARPAASSCPAFEGVAADNNSLVGFCGSHANLMSVSCGSATNFDVAVR